MTKPKGSGSGEWVGKPRHETMILRNLAIVTTAVACFAFAFAMVNSERLDHKLQLETAIRVSPDTATSGIDRR